MHVVLVQIHVKPEYREAFIEASKENGRNSIREPGIQRFDFIQQVEDPDRFVLIEVYNQPEDQQKHRETAHYVKWKDTVTDMMAEPRVGVKYTNLYPPDKAWKK
jgi:quinol monooxygenase YgiN